MTWKTVASQFGVGPSCPFVQFLNDGAMVIPRARTGGFAMPESEASIAGDFPKGASKCTARFRSADETVYFVQEIRVAVLSTRFTWTKDGVPVPEYVEGARGKAKALCLVEGQNGSFLAVLTLSGLASRDFLNAWREHRARVRKATRASGQEAPAALFYMTLAAGETIKLTQGSVRTPIILVGDLDLDRDYIGDSAAQSIDWAEVRAWEERDNGNGAEAASPSAVPAQPEPASGPTDASVSEPANVPASEPAPDASSDLECALNFPCPLPGRTFKAGTPLGDLPDQALEYLLSQSQRFPEAARAAALVLDYRQGVGLPF